MSQRQKKPNPAPKQKSKPDVVTVEPSRCAKCESTERTPYSHTTTIEREIAGEHGGRPYTHVIWRRTKCKSCGQQRMDKSYEFRPAHRSAKRAS